MPFCMASLKFVRACFTTDSSACAPVVPGFHYIIVEWVHEVKSYISSITQFPLAYFIDNAPLR